MSSSEAVGRGGADFSIAALYDALDARRAERGLTWRQAADEINALFADVPAAALSVTTLTGMRTRRSVEGDGLLQMLRWLDRAPETFIPGHPAACLGMEIGRDRVLRFDTRALHAALDARRLELGTTWKTVAAGIGDVTAGGPHRSRARRQDRVPAGRAHCALARPTAARLHATLIALIGGSGLPLAYREVAPLSSHR